MSVAMPLASMMSRGIATLFLLIGLALSTGPAAAQDLVKVPPLTARVTDLTNTLSLAERAKGITKRRGASATSALCTSDTGHQSVQRAFVLRR